VCNFTMVVVQISPCVFSHTTYSFDLALGMSIKMVFIIYHVGPSAVCHMFQLPSSDCKIKKYES
jgi:hypothetical protein